MGGSGRRLRWWVDTTPTPRLREIMASPDAVLASEGSVAREQAGRKRFYRVEGDAAHPAYLVKVFNLPRGPARLRYLARPSKARSEARVARAVTARGFETAAPLAVGEQRRAGLLVRSLVVSGELPAVDLRRKLGDPGLPPPLRRRLVRDFGCLNRALHDAGVDQDDSSPNNFLVRDDGGWVLIDFERCALRRGPLREARRTRLLAKLARHGARLTRGDRLAFVRGYLGDGDSRAARRELWTRVGAELLRVRRRDARRAARAAFKAGRHLVRDAGGWRVRARDGAEVISRELDPGDARRAWVRAHQLERLALPALRPVRLRGARIDLLRPDGLETGAPAAAAIRAAERDLRPFGSFESEPEWVAAGGRAWLSNPECFRPR